MIESQAFIIMGMPPYIYLNNYGSYEEIMGEHSEKELRRAAKCAECPACRYARRKQKGLIFQFVKVIEEGFCPYCVAYEKVYGRKAHEPIPQEKDI